MLLSEEVRLTYHDEEWVLPGMIIQANPATVKVCSRISVRHVHSMLNESALELKKQHQAFR
jgi:hypothetical protein